MLKILFYFYFSTSSVQLRCLQSNFKCTLNLVYCIVNSTCLSDFAIAGFNMLPVPVACFGHLLKANLLSEFFPLPNETIGAQNDCISALKAISEKV